MGSVSGESMETTFMTQILKSFKAAANLQAQTNIRSKENKQSFLPPQQSKELNATQETNQFCLPSINRVHVHDIPHI
jgi:hypothetical protein